MYGLTHLLTGWALGNAALLGRRDRFLAVAAAMVADLDGLGILLGDVAYREFHHSFVHSFFFAFVFAAVLLVFSKERGEAWLPVGLAALSHPLLDLVGTNWSMPLLWPLSSYPLTLSGLLTDEAIYGVLNPLAAIATILLAVQVMFELRRTPMEFVSARYDRRMSNFLVLPFKGARCATCGRRAFFLDERDRSPACMEHVEWEEGDVIVAKAPDGANQTASAPSSRRRA